jgi:hypothetical protein
MFYAESLSIELIEALRPLVARIKRSDRSLADQLRRAASSVALDVAESNYSDPGNRRATRGGTKGCEVETPLRVDTLVSLRDFQVAEAVAGAGWRRQPRHGMSRAVRSQLPYADVVAAWQCEHELDRCDRAARPREASPCPTVTLKFTRATRLDCFRPKLAFD